MVDGYHLCLSSTFISFEVYAIWVSSHVNGGFRWTSRVSLHVLDFEKPELRMPFVGAQLCVYLYHPVFRGGKGHYSFGGPVAALNVTLLNLIGKFSSKTPWSCKHSSVPSWASTVNLMSVSIVSTWNGIEGLGDSQNSDVVTQIGQFSMTGWLRMTGGNSRVSSVMVWLPRLLKALLGDQGFLTPLEPLAPVTVQCSL